MAQQLLKLVASQVKVGWPLPFGIRDADGHLLLAQGQTVASDSQLEALLERGIYVDMEEVRAAKARRDAEAKTARTSTVFDHWDQTIWQLERLFKLALHPDDSFAGQCQAFVQHFMALVKRDPDVAIYLSMRQDPKRLQTYGLTHHLHTSLICLLMGERLGWPQPRVHALMQVSLTMNVAIWELQGRLASVGRISDGQRATIRAHPQEASRLLMAAGVTDPEWLEALVQHHERPDGTGYPHGLTAVSELAAAVSLADVFMAKISPRAERRPLRIQDAARQMFQESKGSPMAAAIIKEYGIYPPGDFVQLASGESAVVIRRGAHAHNPQVTAITDRTGMPVVTSTRRDTSQPAFAIVGPAQDQRLVLRLPPERLFGLI